MSGGRRQQRGEDFTPGPRDGARDITAAPAGHQAPLCMALGQVAQACGRILMRSRCIGQLRKRIAPQAVGAALEDDELGRMAIEMRFDLGEGCPEGLVTGAGRQFEVQLAALRAALARLVRAARARVQRATVLVDVREDQRGIVLEAVEDPVTMMHVDVDVGDAFDAVHAAQCLDHHPAVVVDAEAGGALAPGVMQAPDRLQAGADLAGDDARAGLERRTDDARRGGMHAGEDRCIAVVECGAALCSGRLHVFDVRRRVEAREFFVAGKAGGQQLHSLQQSARTRLAQKCRLTRAAKRMRRREAVIGERLVDTETDTPMPVASRRQPSERSQTREQRATRAAGAAWHGHAPMLARRPAAIKGARNGVQGARAALQARRMRCYMLALSLLAGAAAAGTPPLLPAGEYALSSQMQMPHLDEMRRIVDHHTRCLGDDDLHGLFPVMAQPALRGCQFGFPQARDEGLRYVLVCQSARVATGTAELSRTRAGVVGHLRIKMGGKNMTFAQRVEARRLGTACKAP